MTAKQAMLRTKKITLKDCPDTTWNVIAESEEEILYEWRTIDCPGYGSEYEVAKIIRGEIGMHRLAYANKKLPISKDRRNRWVDLIARARLYSSFAEEGEQASRSARYRIGIFPGGGRFGWIADVGLEERVARTLQTSIQRNRALTLVYSYYDDVLNEPRIKNPERLWVGGAVQKKPNLELVYQLARERAVDGVVMYWGKQLGTSFASGMPNPLWVYLIDVERRQVYHLKGTSKASTVSKLTKRVFADFIKGRGGVSPPQPTVALQAPAQVPAPSEAEAQFALGYRYSLGQGVPKDAVKAVAWYRKAAAQGHARAQYNLGAAYASGTGVSASKYTAADWFFKAGQAFLKAGQREQALQAIDAIENVVPGHVLGKRLLSEIYGQSVQ